MTDATCFKGNNQIEHTVPIINRIFVLIKLNNLFRKFFLKPVSKLLPGLILLQQSAVFSCCHSTNPAPSGLLIGGGSRSENTVSLYNHMYCKEHNVGSGRAYCSEIDSFCLKHKSGIFVNGIIYDNETKERTFLFLLVLM